MIRMKNLATVALFVLGITSCSVAQPGGGYTTTSKKAIKLYETARGCFNEVDPYTGRRNLSCAESNAKNALEKAPEFVEAMTLLSNIYIEMGDLDKAIEYKQLMINNTQNFSQSEFFYLASLQMATGRYDDCIKSSNRYLQNRNANPAFVEKCRQYVDNSHFALHAMKNPVPFEPKNLGANINTERPEYFPSITADDQTLLYTRNIEDPNALAGIGMQEDIFVTEKNGDHWSLGSPLSRSINTIYNEGAPTFSADGKYVIFVGCEIGARGDYEYGEGREGKGSCDLFVSEKIGDEWSKPFNMGAPINTGHWESQPSFSSDGKTLYFIRGLVKHKQRRDPQNQDIYKTEITPDGWSTPVKLNNNVNTPGKEESVQIHPDGQTLYFSSNGHTGMGGLDIYMSRLGPDGEWGKAVNLGYPINTHKDENSVLVASNGDVAYFASNREGGMGSLDLYSFEMPKNMRPIKTTFMKGKVYDEETKKPLAADFQLFDLETGNLFKRAIANSGNGEFIVALPKNKDFALIAEHDGYFFFSKNYSLDKLERNDEGFLLDVPMRPMKGSFVLENVFFDVDLAVLKEESLVELGKLFKILKANPTMNIELSGHTDSDGDDDHNMELSKRRAKAVVDWLIKEGIDSKRLSHKGYGETKPIAPNDTAENKAKNRRTEVLIK